MGEMIPRKKKKEFTPAEWREMITKAAAVGNAEFDFFVVHGRLSGKGDESITSHLAINYEDTIYEIN